MYEIKGHQSQDNDQFKYTGVLCMEFENNVHC